MGLERVQHRVEAVKILGRHQFRTNEWSGLVEVERCVIPSVSCVAQTGNEKGSSDAARAHSHAQLCIRGEVH